MTGRTDAVRTPRGALVGVDPANPLAGLVVFQYNPDEMTRRLVARTPEGDEGAGGARSEALRLTGAPIETISLAVEVDATDQLADGDPQAVLLGIHPQLAALEMLLYPKSSVVLENMALTAVGTIELVPMEAPLTLLVWGAGRVLPVRLTSFSITEQAYDTQLNPIRARADLELRVLSYSDLSVTSPGHHLFLAHQIAKEAMVTLSARSAVGRAVTGGIGGVFR
ncbi:hypothetical protein [Streptomyces sp. B21-101]|uniref:hypothetical protein n=1 Tax=Streptomyces sp. B21-101 TaxID=3039415 RepID=UPI002FF24C1E